MPARVCLSLNGEGGEYWSKRNLIIVRIGPIDLSSWDSSNAYYWPTWKAFLVHEMVHEFEDKIMSFASTEPGRDLQNEAARQFQSFAPIKEHETSFYSAIAMLAPFFGMSVWDFFKNL
jgi:hypothetical protein